MERRDVWSKWDLKLVHAFYLNQAFEIDGHPIHVEESPDIIWVARRKKLRSAEVVDRENERLQKSKGKNHGIRVFAEPTLKPGAKWPTRAAWQARKSMPDAESDEKLLNIGAAQDERARLKLEAMGIKTLD